VLLTVKQATKIQFKNIFFIIYKNIRKNSCKKFFRWQGGGFIRGWGLFEVLQYDKCMWCSCCVLKREGSIWEGSIRVVKAHNCISHCPNPPNALSNNFHYQDTKRWPYFSPQMLILDQNPYYKKKSITYTLTSHSLQICFKQNRTR